MYQNYDLYGLYINHICILQLPVTCVTGNVHTTGQHRKIYIHDVNMTHHKQTARNEYNRRPSNNHYTNI